MLQFSEDYFKGEYRDGFYIEPMMKRAWAGQLEVYMEIAAVCQKHNIRFFADWGTILGAVRHKGFIPWDDDMDIGMLRGDYLRFIKIAQQELPEGYAVVNLHTDENFGNMLTRVVNSRDINLDEEHLKRYHGCPYALGLDVFPIDYIPRDPEDEEMEKELLRIILTTAKVLAEMPDADKGDLMKNLRDIENLCGVKFTAEKSLSIQLYELAENICSMYTEEDADCVTSMTDLVNGWEYRPSKECYASSIMMPFENVKVPVPVGYDEVLKVKYGENYMTPINQGGGHDYPFYNKQKPFLIARLQELGMSGEPFGV